MSNLHGSPIWYELLSLDPLAARRFYSAVVGWKIDEAPPAGSTMDYRMITAAECHVGGVFRLTPEMSQQGARPAWMMYLGVDDVDQCVASVTAAGGSALLPAFDIPYVGRLAMLADPQGAPFYVMRGASDADSGACNPDRPGHGAWHELHATDGPSATAFYLAQFGWGQSVGMDMGPMGVYQLFSVNGRDLGGIMSDANFPRPCWLPYFRVDGIERAAVRIVEAGGRVVHGPMEVPGGGWIVNGLDTEGALFALTGTR
jgi:predicted enzyme related to lactoylglutathione lyase